MTDELNDLGYSALNYHAGLTNAVRADHQTKFIRDQVQIMVATLAFGMGIDKPNVRFVIHHTMPKSIEQYYQEIGRAGRDGLPSEAMLLYSKGDAFKLRYLFDDSADKDRAELLLKGMINYVSGQCCRRQALLQYFGEDFVPVEGAENCCDVCDEGPVPMADLTIPVQKLMSCIIRTGSKFGSAYVIDVLLGAKQKKIFERKHDELSTYGIGTELTRDQWFELIDLLILRDFLMKVGDYGILVITQNGLEILRKREKVLLPFRAAQQIQMQNVDLSAKSPFAPKSHTAAGSTGGLMFPKPEKKSKSAEKPAFVLHKKTVDFSDDEKGQKIAEELKKWRKKTAQEQDVPPYIIFGDKTLNDIAQKKPETMGQLLCCSGIGESKAEKYGDAILEICNG